MDKTLDPLEAQFEAERNRTKFVFERTSALQKFREEAERLETLKAAEAKKETK